MDIAIRGTLFSLIGFISIIAFYLIYKTIQTPSWTTVSTIIISCLTFLFSMYAGLGLPVGFNTDDVRGTTVNKIITTVPIVVVLLLFWVIAMWQYASLPYDLLQILTLVVFLLVIPISITSIALSTAAFNKLNRFSGV
jgi:hypothetical protein